MVSTAFTVRSYGDVNKGSLREGPWHGLEFCTSVWSSMQGSGLGFTILVGVRGGEVVSRILPPLVHSLPAYDSWDWARVKMEPRNLM